MATSCSALLRSTARQAISWPCLGKVRAHMAWGTTAPPIITVQAPEPIPRAMTLA